MSKEAMEQQIGHEKFLRHIARFQQEPVEVKKGMSEAVAYAKLFKKLGITPDDLATFRAINNDYMRAAGQSFITSFESKNLSGMDYFSKCAHLTNEIPLEGRGQVLALELVARHSWEPAAEARSELLPTEPFYRHCHLHGDGVGTGISWPWTSETGVRGQSCFLEYKCSFTPSETKVYTLSSGLVASGTYYLVASDGPCDSKEARCSYGAGIVVQQSLPSPVTIVPGVTASEVYAESPFVELFGRSGGNILEGDLCSGNTRPNLSVLLFADLPVNISVLFHADAWARGDGSIADLNLAFPAGAIYCGGVYID